MTRKTRAKPRYRWADPADFRVERLTAGLSARQAADYLGVCRRTITNWENGSRRIPYPAFKLIRMRAKALVHVPGWDGWRFAPDGALVTPTGRSFQPWEIEQLYLVVGLARRYVEARTRRPAARLRAGAVLPNDHGIPPRAARARALA